jgi:hypothetical protein
LILDEPGLAEGEVEQLAPVVRALRALGVEVGVHDCGPGFRHALGAAPDLLSFDFATYGADVPSSDTDPLRTYVRAGGALGWGVVSTTPGRIRAIDAEVAARDVRCVALDLMGTKQGERELLRRSLVTPACGTALLSAEEATLVHESAAAVARVLRASLE